MSTIGNDIAQTISIALNHSGWSNVRIGVLVPSILVWLEMKFNTEYIQVESDGLRSKMGRNDTVAFPGY